MVAPSDLASENIHTCMGMIRTSIKSIYGTNNQASNNMANTTNANKRALSLARGNDDCPPNNSNRILPNKL